jgi:hypothetical protein
VCTPQSQVLGVTNKHVADGLASCTDYVSSGLQIGGARLDPARLIARHQDLDLATFQLSDVFLATSGHNAATVSTWPPKAPSEGDPVIYGGFPASYREDYDGTIDFGFAIFVGKVQSVSDRNIAMVLEIERSESLSSGWSIPMASNVLNCVRSSTNIPRLLKSRSLTHWAASMTTATLSINESGPSPSPVSTK